MTFLLYFAGLGLIATVAALVAAPLFTPPTGSTLRSEAEPQTARWEKQKIAAYAAIKEAEFDHQMGKLTDEDYQSLREKYEARAVEALTQLDRLGHSEKEQEHAV